MSKTEIKSENQSGGITAQNVNIGDKAEFQNKNPQVSEESPTRSLFWWIFGIAGLVVAGITIFQFFE